MDELNVWRMQSCKVLFSLHTCLLPVLLSAILQLLHSILETFNIMHNHNTEEGKIRLDIHVLSLSFFIGGICMSRAVKLTMKSLCQHLHAF